VVVCCSQLSVTDRALLVWSVSLLQWTVHNRHIHLHTCRNSTAIKALHGLDTHT